MRFRRPPCRPSHSQGESGIGGRGPGIREVCVNVRSKHLPFWPLTAGPWPPFSIPTWSRTRTKTLGGSCAFRYTIGTQEPTTGFAPASSGLQDRRLAKSSHVGTSTSARSRTPYSRFGSCLLSQEHTRVKLPANQPGAVVVIYFSSSTFQYASLTNFDQLSIRTSRIA